MTFMTTRRTLLEAFPALLHAQRHRPNFLFFMTDDQRFDAMSCAGNAILKTPNLDRIASGGVRFSQAFVTNSLCSPSRGTIITGLYSHAHGVASNASPRNRFKPGIPMFPKLLRQAGYFTALTGKWHIPSEPEGFDHWAILPGQGVYGDPTMLVEGSEVRMRGYVDDIICDQAMETLRNRPKDRPFCLLCWFKGPHRSWEPAARFAARYENATIPEPATFHLDLARRPSAIRNSDMQVADMPDFLDLGVSKAAPREEKKRLNYQFFLKQYYRVLLGVDENVGRLLDYLDREKLAENTFVIHTSDNGFFAGECGLFDKRMMYEPSIRVPLLVRYPAGFQGGRVDADHTVLNNDICHTILDYAGIARPPLMRNHGESWRPILEGRSTEWRDSWMYQYFEYPSITCVGKMRGVRTKRWKLIHYIQQPEEFELFDLERDPEERNNLFGDPAHRWKAGELRRELERLRDVVLDDRSEDGTPAKACAYRLADLPFR